MKKKSSIDKMVESNDEAIYETQDIIKKLRDDIAETAKILAKQREMLREQIANLKRDQTKE